MNFGDPFVNQRSNDFKDRIEQVIGLKNIFVWLICLNDGVVLF